MINITVLMPVKNGEPFLNQAIQQIEENVKKDDEIIVVDDGSEDGTQLILKKWSKDNHKVRVLRNPKLGLVEALNLGIRESSNDWIARFDVDDGYRPERLGLQRSLITGQTAAIFSDYEFIAENGKNFGVIPSPMEHAPTTISLHFSQQTPHPGVLYNRRSIESVGGYRKSDFPAEDISLWLRLAKVGQLVSVPETLLSYRLSRNSVSAQNRKIAVSITRSVVSEIGVNPANALLCLDTWKEIGELYSVQKLGAQRTILFYRNLKKALVIAGLTKANEYELRKLRNLLFSDFKYSSAVLGLAKDRSMRQVYRRGQTSH
jgi:glycosyltransferase involved in cell wall biosynthesis